MSSSKRGRPGLESAMRRFVRRYLRCKTQRRLHLSNKKLSLRQFEDRSDQQKVDHKPHGLWYGINDSWIDWCLSDSPGWLSPYIYEVILDEDRILKIGDIPTFEAFEAEHYDLPEYRKALGESLDGWSELQTRLASFEMTGDFVSPWGRMRFFDNMNYAKVAEKFGAMEIVPYLYKKRLHSMWYYGWDCASGCVWNRSVIKELRLFAAYDKEANEFRKFDLQPQKVKV